MKFKTNLTRSTNLINLTPLVDVIFLLLIFFIVTSEILPLKSLHIENPTIDKDSHPLTTQLFLVMDKEQVIYLGSKKTIVDFMTLEKRLYHEIDTLKKRNGGIEPTLVLSVDKGVDYGTFLQLFSIVQDCSKKIRLVYKPLDPENEKYL